MAASCTEFQNWRNTLNQHPICKHLREKSRSGTSHLNIQNKETKKLISVQCSDLFIWSSSEGCVLHCNLKALALEYGESETGNRISASGAADNNGTIGGAFQRLVLADIISYEVDTIAVNSSGSHLLLWGSKGLRVLELPRRWGKNAVFEGGKETISCRTTSFCEKSLSRNSSLKILKVAWHPGSLTHSHLAVLTSDNKFSVYHTQSPEQPLSSILISPSDIILDASPSKTFVEAALGEVAVDFDFGTPIVVHEKQRPLQGAQSLDISRSTSSIEVWPVYCVHGNGTVMLLYSHVSDIRSIELPVQGPLAMYPPADDNYGVDACSIMCLSTPVPVIVISTCEGRLHHCVQLPSSDDDSQLANDSLSVSKFKSVAELYEIPLEPILYVIETAVLDLCLTGPEIEDFSNNAEEDEFMCPVMLCRDGNSTDRYHCSHAAGVHSVALPWLSYVQQFFLDDSPDLSMPEEECVVEHVLCTKPLYSCPTSPVLGVDVVTDPLLGATLLILSSDLEFTILPIGFQYQVTSPSKDASGSSSGNSIAESVSSAQSNREPFKKQLENILQRKYSVPILKSDPHAELSQQSMFQILSRVTSLLREEYIHKQDQARQQLQTRILTLQQRKEHQMHDVHTLLDQKNMLCENATAISEKLEKAKDDHEVLLKRLETLRRRIQSRVPVLSEAEKQEIKELNAIKSNLDIYKQNIDQVRVKQEYQERQMKRPSGADSPVLRQRQLAQIKDILQDESTDIEDLKKDVNRLNLSLN